METTTEQQFRFTNRKDYETAMTKLITSRKGVRLERRDARDKEYEALAEEYIMFCDAKENGD